MGSFIELNDTLQLNREQGFPDELNLEKHLVTPYTIADVKDKVFSFRDKPNIRAFQMPPVRNFLVENRNGKWICWGLCHILEVTHDYVKKVTHGKFKIVRLYIPEEMKKATPTLWGEESLQYFS